MSHKFHSLSAGEKRKNETYTWFWKKKNFLKESQNSDFVLKRMKALKSIEMSLRSHLKKKLFHNEIVL